MMTREAVLRLLDFHDDLFVEVTYQALLGREPDPDGMNHYLSRLRVGCERSQIILEVAASAEAHARGILVSELAAHLTVSKPSGFRPWGSAARGDAEERKRLLRVENQLGRLTQDVGREATVAKSRTEMILDPLRHVNANVDAGLRRHSQELATMQQEIRSRVERLEAPIRESQARLDAELQHVLQRVEALAADVGLCLAKLEQSIASTNKLAESREADRAVKKGIKQYEDAIAPISSDYVRPACPKYSIVILQFHKSELTINCVRSILRNTALKETEIIVVDNGSDRKHVASVVAEFGEQVVLVDIGINRYFGEGNNIGADHAAGQYVIFMNNDIVVTKGWLERLTPHLMSDSDIVGPAFLYPDGRVQECGGYMKANGESIQQYKGGDLSELPPAAFTCDYVSAALILMKKHTFLKVGGFDLCYEPAYYEDVDLCFKVASFGGKVICVPSVLIFHNENATSSDATLGLKLTGDIITTNKTKFLDRWGKFLRGRVANPIESQHVVGSFSAPIRDVSSIPRLTTRGRAILFSPYPLTPGGGEKYLLTIAQELSRSFETSIAFQQPYSSVRLRQLESYLHLDLAAVNFMEIGEAQKQSWDVSFVLGNSVSPPFTKLAPQSFYICQFPFDRSSHLGKALPHARGYHYLCYSDFVRDHVLDGSFVAPERITVLAPVVEPYPLATAKEKIIISVGRFFVGGHCKNQHLLIEAFRRLVTKPEFADWKLVLVGSTRPEHEHRMYYGRCMEAAIGLNVQIIPDASFDVLAAVYAKAAVYWHGSGLGVDPEMHPEQLEHFGITPLEAASAGCHVFVPNAGGPREVASKAPGRFYVYASIDELVAKTTDVVATILGNDPHMNIETQRFVGTFSEQAFASKLAAIISETEPDNYCDLSTLISSGDHRVRWIDWYNDEGSYRWSRGYQAKIEFLWDDECQSNIWLTLRFHSLGAQYVGVSVNDGEPTYTQADGGVNLLNFKAKSFIFRKNTLTFFLPNAHQPGTGDTRMLALAFWSLTFRSFAESPLEF